MKKIKLIVNPKAGNGIGMYYIPIIKKKFKDYHLDIYKTKSKGDATREAKKSKEDIIIATGGDGTINEVINGMVNSKSKLGIIPIGTGNVFAKELKLPINIYKICNIIKKSKIKKYDLGKANNNYFLLWCGIGFDAHVLHYMKPLMKRILGITAYPITAFKKSLRYRSPELQITIDNKIKKKGYFLMISNIKNYGRMFQFSPNADPFDGKLDICLFQNKFEFFNIIKNMIKIKTKLHLKSKDIFHCQAKKIKVESISKVLVHTDAEVIGTTPVSISIVPKTISIIIP